MQKNSEKKDDRNLKNGEKKYQISNTRLVDENKDKENKTKEYILGKNEKTSVLSRLKNIQASDVNKKIINEKEFIDIIFIEDEKETQSELSKITEVEYSLKHYSHEKFTNSFVNSKIENDKLNDQIIHKFSTSPTHKRSLTSNKPKQQAVQISSDSLFFTRSNNNSKFEHSDLKIEDKNIEKDFPKNPLGKINFQNVGHRSKSHSLDLGLTFLKKIDAKSEFKNYQKNKTFDNNNQIKFDEKKNQKNSLKDIQKIKKDINSL